MADFVIMPRLSLNEDSSMLSQWYVAEGDTVAVGDKLFCIETDKSTMDVESEFAGVVLKKYYGDDEVVDVLAPVCVIGAAGEAIPSLDSYSAQAEGETAAAPEAKEAPAAGGLDGMNVVIMPRLSLNDETSLLAEWYVKEGDTVAVGDRLFSIETDKSSMDVESEFAGVVLKTYYGNEEVVDVLTPVCVIGEAGKTAPALEALANVQAEAPAEEAKAGAVSAAAGLPDGCNAVIMPRLSLNDETCMLSEWYVKEGDTVAVGDSLFSIETDKSSMDVESEFAGVVLKAYYGNDEVVDVLTPVCVIGKEGSAVPELEALLGAAAAAEEAPAEEAPKAAAPAPKKEAPVVTTEWRGVSPRARKLAAEKGIKDFSRMQASGAENRILEEDVLRYIESGAATQATGEKRVIKLPKIRKVIAKNMMNSLQNSAQLTMSAVFNATGIQACRERFKNEQGAMKGVTIGDLILFATARTLKEFPYMNTWMVSDDEAIEFVDVNLGCAVDTDRGLMVPTLMNAGNRSLLDISNELKDLAGQCRVGNISPDKLKEGTFTVTNLGAFGIRTFTPVINPPQVGILGVGTIDYMMKKSKDGIVCYPGCTLSLTVDHRYVDGGPAARFLKKLCENLENIEALIEE